MPIARPTMFASASGELKTRVAAESALQTVRDLEDAALARHLVERFARLTSATSSPKTTIRGSRRHLVVERPVDERRPSCRACRLGSTGVSNAADVGSTSGE